jgi:DNA-binding transcriptional ArsR family regulator
VRDVHIIDTVETAATLLKPLRLEILRRMDAAVGCGDLAADLGQSPQKIHYHVKALEKAGLIEKVGERKARALTESLYRATACSFWLAPGLVARVGEPGRAPERDSVDYLVALAEELTRDVVGLAHEGVDDGATLGVTAEIRLRDPAQRRALLSDLFQAIEAVARKHGADPFGRGEAGEAYRIAVASYPRAAGPEDEAR